MGYPRIALVFRAPSRYWSIEQVFETVFEHPVHGFNATRCAVPYSRANLQSLIGNTHWVSATVHADLIHITGDVHYAILGVYRRPTLLTIHDLRFYEESRGFKRWVFWWLWLYLPCWRASCITVISEFTKQRLIKATNLPKNKVKVVPNCVSPRFKAQPKTWPDSVIQVLQVGTTTNKNIDRLAEACAGLPVRVCVLGKLGQQQRGTFERLGVRVNDYSDLPQAEVVKLYQDSDLITFASTYEGFGMPILEGQAVGRPVMTSDLAPMKDVAGKGALLVDPFDVESIRAGLKQLLEDPALRERLVAGGFENVKKYSAKAVAEQYAQVYREVLASK